MTANNVSLLQACLGMVVLTFLVGVRLLTTRVQEMRHRRIRAQAIATSTTMAARLDNVQAADNFRNLFEVPVLFYALAASALAVAHVPGWLVICAWIFFALRVVHSFIHCTYNKVVHRLAAFGLSFALLVAMWAVFVLTLPAQAPA